MVSARPRLVAALGWIAVVGLVCGLIMIIAFGQAFTSGPAQYQAAQPSTKSITRNPSPVLAKDQPVALHLWESTGMSPAPVRTLEMQIATQLTASGFAELVLTMADGTQVSHVIDIAGINNRQYRAFDVGGRTPVSGELVYRTGGNIMMIEATADGGPVGTCANYILESGETIRTPGCS
jgi:hypothetical protein